MMLALRAPLVCAAAVALFSVAIWVVVPPYTRALLPLSVRAEPPSPWIGEGCLDPGS